MKPERPYDAIMALVCGRLVRSDRPILYNP
jgi:hypothetical protein